MTRELGGSCGSFKYYYSIFLQVLRLIAIGLSKTGVLPKIRNGDHNDMGNNVAH
jgi:hypothetical protein